jgi:hypothetical protein
MSLGLGLGTVGRALLPAAAAAAIAGATGCTGSSIRSGAVTVSQAAVPVAVDETLGAFEDPLNRTRLEQILGTPEMQRAIQDTAQAAVLGILQPETGERAGALGADITHAALEALTEDIQQKIIPAAVEAMRDAIREAVTPESSEAMRHMLDTAVRQATTSAIRSASAEIPSTLAPSIRAALIENLNSADLRQAVDGIAADATRSALLSSRDVILDLRGRDGPAGPFEHLVTRMERLLDRIEKMLVAVMIAAFAGVAALVGLGVWAVRRLRREPTHAS